MIKKIIKNILTKLGYKIVKIDQSIEIVEKDNFETVLMQKIKKFTLTTDERIWLIIQSIKNLVKNNIEGDIVECGVWRGGNVILLGELCKKFNFNRKIFGFDTFEGMTKPTEDDVSYFGKSARKLLQKYKKDQKNEKNIWAYSSLDDTLKNIKENTSYQNIELVKGDVKETLNQTKNLPEKISLLRLDTDFYESTKKELEVLYPLLTSGGILIIDDYGHWKGCRKAVDEYFREKNIEFFMCDFSCRYFIKK